MRRITPEQEFCKLGIATIFLLALVAGGLSGPVAAQERRTALVIGNGKYHHAVRLPNPVYDARAVAAALKRLDFDVLDGIDAKRSEMENLLDDFGAKAERSDIALVFYAGHGIQVEGENYLLPVDARLKRKGHLRKLIKLKDVMDEAGQARKLGVVILDACRDNPLARSLRERLGPTRSAAVGRGLAEPDPPTNTLVAFATRADAEALDSMRPGSATRQLLSRLSTLGVENVSSHSPYTAALLAHLEEPGLDIRILFGKVRDTVLAVTNWQQKPYTYGSLGGEALYLKVARPIPPVREPAVGTVFQDRLKDGGRGPEMVVIPAGEFWMGSPDDEDGRDDDERRHRVRIESDFALGKHEITVGEFRRFVDRKGYRTEAEKSGGCYYWDGSEWEWDETKTWKSPGFAQTDAHPVVCMSWNDAVAYAEWLSGQTGEDYGLPTEAQWEYAARGGKQTARYWGDGPEGACRYASVSDLTAAKALNWTQDPSNIFMCEDDYVYTAPVGRFRANAYGLYDMLGNVWEWTCSKYEENYSGAERQCLGKNNANSARRVLRGGSWNGVPRHVRAAFRVRGAPANRYHDIGFRLARPL